MEEMMKKMAETFANVLGMDMDIIRRNVALAKVSNNERLVATAELMSDLIGGTGGYDFREMAQVKTTGTRTYNRDANGRFCKKEDVAPAKKTAYRDAKGRFCKKEDVEPAKKTVYRDANGRFCKKEDAVITQTVETRC